MEYLGTVEVRDKGGTLLGSLPLIAAPPEHDKAKEFYLRFRAVLHRYIVKYKEYDEVLRGLAMPNKNNVNMDDELDTLTRIQNKLDRLWEDFNENT